VAVIGTKAVAAGLKPVSILKEGEGKVQKISSFPPVVCNINKLTDEIPLGVIDVDYYVDLVSSKMEGLMDIAGIQRG
jgi:hypothetical protein